MIKQLTRIGNSQGIILDKAILDLLKIKDGSSFEVTTKNGGLFLKPIDIQEVYQDISKRHRKTLDKLGR
jgi:antitoxin component of MazEF toxin-antitoxin module